MNSPHPTPLHIRGCIRDALWDAAKEWEADTGQVAPYALFSQAAMAGVTRAIREHEAEQEELHRIRTQPQYRIAAE